MSDERDAGQPGESVGDSQWRGQWSGGLGSAGAPRAGDAADETAAHTVVPPTPVQPGSQPSEQSHAQTPYGQPAYGQPGHGQQSAYGQQPAYGQPPYGQVGGPGQVPPPPPYGPPGGYPAYGYPAATASGGTNGMAIASLVLGILWLYWIGSILALIFGYIALGQIKRNPQQQGKGMAIAGVVLGWVGVALIVIGLTVFVSTGSSSGYSSP